ncbi:hypothetical protein, partial [Actinotignum timonense]|uniref:hypothetical protein n=1 Tax=Actinotignum timonense TaxID=1870995 RepID=UPI002A7F91B9
GIGTRLHQANLHVGHGTPHRFSLVRPARGRATMSGVGYDPAITGELSEEQPRGPAPQPSRTERVDPSAS